MNNKIHARPLIKQLLLLFPLTFLLGACAAKNAENVDPKPSKEEINALVKDTLSKMSFVEGGTFMMGDFGPEKDPSGYSYTGEPSARPLHEVTLDSFSIMQYRVTYDQFDIYTAAKRLPKIGYVETKGILLTSRLKARQVPNMSAGTFWAEAKAYCQWLGKQAGVKMDLPTEAQWEYAARNRGEYVLYATDNGQMERGVNVPSYEQAMSMNSPHMAVSYIYPVAFFKPNPLGLYAMGFGGYEWVNDWFAEDYYEHSPKLNPQGPKTGEKKVVRSSYHVDRRGNMTMSRHAYPPDVVMDLGRGVGVQSPAPLMVRCVANHPKPLN